MIPAGYMSKRVAARPDWLQANGVVDIYSVSGCISEYFVDYIKCWKQNGYWFFNSPREIEEVSREHGVDTTCNRLFYYEVFENQFDKERKWAPFQPEASSHTQVQKPENARLVGYDVTSFWAGSSPECSPLSCNGMAESLATNKHCLFDTFDEATRALEAGHFDNCEPGPYRIIAVYEVETDDPKR